MLLSAMTPALSSFATGLLIGGGASLLGAMLSYWFGLRQVEGRNDGHSGAPLAYLFLVPLILSFIGAVALVLALFNGRPVGLVLVMGFGVVFGFTLVFALLLFAYVRRDNAA
jgi:hypothetical protein